MVDWAGEASGDAEHWPDLLALMRFWFRDLMIMAGGGRADHLVNLDIADDLRQAGHGRRPEEFARALAQIDEAENALNRLIRPDLVFENLMLGLADLGKA
jgi:hypothetical protein